MNFQKVQRKNRKAISPVLATVILIAITLIAAIAIAGFVFGLFGSFTSSAQVSAQDTSCVGATDYCKVSLTNSGTSNVAVTGCSIQIAGTARLNTTASLTTARFNVPASGSATFNCVPAAVTAQTVGSQAIGSFSLSNGASVPFSGTWS
jgi:flagellin-like protein